MSALFEMLLLKQQEEIMTKLSEISTLIQQVVTGLDKAKTEILGKIEALESQLTDVSLPDDAETALSALKDRVQALDDIVPDTTPSELKR